MSRSWMLPEKSEETEEQDPDNEQTTAARTSRSQAERNEPMVPREQSRAHHKEPPRRSDEWGVRQPNDLRTGEDCQTIHRKDRNRKADSHIGFSPAGRAPAPPI